MKNNSQEHFELIGNFVVDYIVADFLQVLFDLERDDIDIRGVPSILHEDVDIFEESRK